MAQLNTNEGFALVEPPFLSYQSGFRHRDVLYQLDSKLALGLIDQVIFFSYCPHNSLGLVSSDAAFNPLCRLFGLVE